MTKVKTKENPVNVDQLASTVNLERLPSEESTMEMDGIRVNVDEAKVSKISKEIEERKAEFSKKVYAISMSKDAFSLFKEFIHDHAEWASTEALGIIEISKTISKIEKEGIKDETVYMNPLTIEASHYFVSKKKGTGLKEAQEFIKLYKSFDVALGDVRKDNLVINNLQKELSAAQQGIDAV
jgi:hypothetical protein